MKNKSAFLSLDSSSVFEIALMLLEQQEIFGNRKRKAQYIAVAIRKTMLTAASSQTIFMNRAAVATVTNSNIAETRYLLLGGKIGNVV